jgi:hypothetical protein
VALLEDEARRVGQRRSMASMRDHGRARRHDLGGRRLRQAEHAADHLHGLLLQQAVLVRLGQQQLQLLRPVDPLQLVAALAGRTRAGSRFALPFTTR